MTKKYVLDMLESAGLIKPTSKQLGNRVQELLHMDKQNIRNLADDISERVFDHYQHNLSSLLRHINTASGQKGLYFGYAPLYRRYEGDEDIDSILRKACLYYDKLVLVDTLFETLSLRIGFKPEAFKTDFLSVIGIFGILMPWIEDEMVELVPPPYFWEGIDKIADLIGAEDENDTEWRKEAISCEDEGKEVSDLLGEMQSFVDRYLVVGKGKRKNEWVKYFARGASRVTTSDILASGLIGCSPVTNLEGRWRLLGLWLKDRIDLIVRGGLLDEEQAKRMKTGATIVNLETKKLGFLRGLSHKRIRELRTSDEYRFNDFRRKWAEVCKDLKKLPWEEGFKKDANDLWATKIEPEAKRVRKDLISVKRKLGASVGLSALGITTSLIPGLTFVGLATAILPLLVPQISLPETMTKLKQIKKDERNDTYFLVAAQKS